MNKGSTHGFDSKVGWWERAICQQVDPEMFFPGRGESPGRALHVCRTHCPVLADCHAWSQGKPWDAVVVGGVHHVERATEKKRVSQARPSAAGCVLCRSES